MRPIFYALLVSILMSMAPLKASDHDSRIADITDRSGTVTHVTGLHYCYEEEENGELYINKYDEFYVKRGDAIIKAPFENLAYLEFQGKVKTEGDFIVRDAFIITRAGKELNVMIVRHKGSFIKGNVELGEFNIDLDKIVKMDFSGGKNNKPQFATRIIPKGETPAHAFALLVNQDGTMVVEGAKEAPKGKDLKEAIKGKGYVVFMRCKGLAPHTALLKALITVQKAGAKMVLLGQ